MLKFVFETIRHSDIIESNAFFSEIKVFRAACTVSLLFKHTSYFDWLICLIFATTGISELGTWLKRSVTPAPMSHRFIVVVQSPLFCRVMGRNGEATFPRGPTIRSL